MADAPYINPLDRCEQCHERPRERGTWFMLALETNKITAYEYGHPSAGHEVALLTVMLCSWKCVRSYAATKET